MEAELDLEESSWRSPKTILGSPAGAQIEPLRIRDDAAAASSLGIPEVPELSNRTKAPVFFELSSWKF